MQITIYSISRIWPIYIYSYMTLPEVVYCYALLLFRPVAGKVPTVLKTAEEGYLHVWLIYNLQHVHTES